MKKLFWILMLLPLAFAACEQDIDLNLPDAEPQLVVEGYVENGQPPYLLLSNSASIFSDISIEEAEKFFVHDAKVTVSDGTQSVELQELTIDTAGFKLSVYTTFDMKGEVGKTYTLTVEAQGKTLTASTTIPHLLPLDSIWFEPHPDADADSLVRVLVQYSDPPEPDDQVRYFTSRNGHPFWPGYNSVYEDAQVNGLTFEVPIDRGIDRTNSVNWNTYPYFSRGDSVVLKWASIDRPHFEFWRSLEFQMGNSGNPFGSITRINSNIEGGLGIWGGYGASYYTLLIPK